MVGQNISNLQCLGQQLSVPAKRLSVESVQLDQTIKLYLVDPV